MAIAKKPKSNTTAIVTQDDDPKAVAFITGAAKAPSPPPPPPEPETGKTPVMVRFDSSLLRRVDEAAKRRCISRSAWIQSTLSRTLDSGEG